MNRKNSLIAAAIIATGGFAAFEGYAQTLTSISQTAAPSAVRAKTNEVVDTTYSRAGDKVSVILQGDVMVKETKLPKGTKLTGTVVKSVKQDKQNPHAGVILLLDTAVLKDGSSVPVHVAITSLAPSAADKIEKIDAGSGDITDASLYAGMIRGGMTDPNSGVTAHTGTAVNGVKASSDIKGVVLFAAPDGNSSGVIIARTGSLQLDKWTQMNVVVTPR